MTEKLTEENVVDEAKAIEVEAKAEVAEKPKKVVSPKKVAPAKAAAETKKAATKKKAISRETEFKTDSGFRVKLVPVAANTLREAQTRIPDPVMRTYTHPTSGKEMENPAHPEYITDLNVVKEERIKATMDAMVLFGLELLDPIPEDNRWLKKCLFTNLITQEQYDEAIGVEGEFLRELFYKNYIVSDFKIVNQIASMSGITQEMIAQARESFPGNA